MLEFFAWSFTDLHRNRIHMGKTIRALTSKKRLNEQALCQAASHTVNQHLGFDQDQINTATLNLARLLGRQLAIEEFGAPTSLTTTTKQTATPTNKTSRLVAPSNTTPLQRSEEKTTIAQQMAQFPLPKIIGSRARYLNPLPDE
jgi:hypothetical protein